MRRQLFTVLAVTFGLCGAPVLAANKSRSAERAKARAAKAKRPPAAPIIEPASGPDEEITSGDDAASEAQSPVPTPSPPPAPIPSPAPAAAEAADPEPNAQDAALDPEALRARYDQLRDQVFRSRARRETMENALFSTKVAFEVRWEANRRYRLDKAEVRLDGTRIWDATERPITEDPIQLAQRAVAPGRHVLTIRLEVHSRDKLEMGYTSEQNFHVNLPEGKASRVRIAVDEDGSLPSYNPEIEVKVDD